MEIHQLEYVLAVGKNKNFTRAAQEINISQSSLSQQISKLESELGIQLFIRTTRSVELTPAGSEFMNLANRIMTEIHGTKIAMQEYSTIEKGQLSIGVIPVAGHYDIPSLLSAFYKAYPAVKLNLMEEQCFNLEAMVKSGKLDCAFVHLKNSDHSIDAHPIISDKMVLVTSRLHRLAYDQSVALKDLHNELFITTPESSGHFLDFCDACNKAGFEPKVFVSCSSVKTILGFVKEGIGVTCLSSAVARDFMEPGLLMHTISPKISRKITLVTYKNSSNLKLISIFAKFTNRWVAENKGKLFN